MPVPQSRMMDMAGFGNPHISTQGEDKWESHKEGAGKDYERRPLATRSTR